MEKLPNAAKSDSILIKQALVCCPGSEHHLRTTDILIKDGMIKQMGSTSSPSSLVIDGTGCVLAPGLFDLRARHGEPGQEQNEDVESLGYAASFSGFTGLATLPDTTPCVSSRAQVEFLSNKSARALVEMYPLGATTVDLEGKELTEIYDMHLGGARGFSNADHPYHSGTLERALLYVKPFNGMIFSHAEDRGLSRNGMVNESIHTADLGLKAFPAHAEYTAVAREIEILRYTGSHLHFSHLSSARSVQLIREAKAEGLKVSCDAAILSLIYNDESLRDFDANFKLMPPLRNETDRKAIIEGINDGTIDCIVSDHNPHCPENKLVEFNFSPFGAITLQVFYSLYATFLQKEITLERFIEASAIQPRKLLRLDLPEIAENKPANLALFNPEYSWTFESGNNRSRSANSHLLGTSLSGKCLFVSNQNHYLFHL